MTDTEDQSDAVIKFVEELDLDLEKIRTADDFSEYMEKLEWGYANDLLEEQPLEEYLSGITNVSGAIDGLVKNYGYKPPGPTDWKWVARILTTAFWHS